MRSHIGTLAVLRNNHLKNAHNIKTRHFVTAWWGKIKQRVMVLMKSGSEEEVHDVRPLLTKIRNYDGDDKDVMGRLIMSVSSLQRYEYEKQLQIKELLCERYQMKLRNALWHNFKKKSLHPDLLARLERGGPVFDIPKLLPSPVIDGYRNKDHPVIAPGVDGKPCVGYYVVPGKFPDLDVVCGQLRAIRQQHFELMQALTEGIRASGLPALGQRSDGFARQRAGHWRMVLIRSNTSGDLLVGGAGVHWNNPDLLIRMKHFLVNFFVHGSGRSFNVKSLSFQEQPITNPKIERYPYEILHGSSSIMEELNGLRFSLSPGSFFQVNTPAAELMYEKVRDLCQLDKDTILLDLCCGTGTIGMVLAKYVKQVVGIEENGRAVLDAIKNAELNNVDNIAFITGAAEKKLEYLLKRTVFPGNKPNIVAVVNPPRAGLGVRFIRTLRNCEEIRKVVYISCKPYGPILKNFIGLMQPAHAPDKKIVGAPFLVTKTEAIDMFPHTRHFELLLLLER